VGARGIEKESWSEKKRGGREKERKRKEEGGRERKRAGAKGQEQERKEESNDLERFGWWGGSTECLDVPWIFPYCILGYAYSGTCTLFAIVHVPCFIGLRILARAPKRPFFAQNEHFKIMTSCNSKPLDPRKNVYSTQLVRNGF
jgi:hypothetical protein